LNQTTRREVTEASVVAAIAVARHLNPDSGGAKSSPRARSVAAPARATAREPGSVPLFSLVIDAGDNARG